MDDGIVSILASDAHDFQYRTPSMERLMGYLERRYPWKQVQVWTSENPSRILKEIHLWISRQFRKGVKYYE